MDSMVGNAVVDHVHFVVAAGKASLAVVLAHGGVVHCARELLESLGVFIFEDGAFA